MNSTLVAIVIDIYSQFVLFPVSLTSTSDLRKPTKKYWGIVAFIGFRSTDSNTPSRISFPPINGSEKASSRLV